MKKDKLDKLVDFLPIELRNLCYDNICKNDLAHSFDHIYEVVVSGYELFNLVELNNKDKLIVLLGCLLHDIGCHVNRDNHHLISKQLFDEFINNNKDMEITFNNETYKLVELQEEAGIVIKEHRSSYKGDRSRLSYVVSLADKGIIEPLNFLERGFKYRRNSGLSFEDKVNEIVDHFIYKFGPNGYGWDSFPEYGKMIYGDKINHIKDVFKDNETLTNFIYLNKDHLENL